MDEREVHQELARRRMDDAHARLRYQHEFSVEGFKTLVLINGGAIVGLLTFAGDHVNAARDFRGAFIGFTGGLIAAVLAYLVAYLSQSEIMQMDQLEAYRLLGIQPQSSRSRDSYWLSGTIAIGIAIVLTVGSLGAFVTGSWCAISALSSG